MQYDSTVNGFPYFSQNDDRWNGIRYGGGNISTSGCGPTSAAMILKSYHFDVTPKDTAALFVNTIGYQTTIGSTCFGSLQNAPYNLTVENTKSISSVVEALKKGIPVVANPQGPCDFTSGGHYIVLCGITSDGNIQVNDPNGNHYEMSKSKTWTPEYINNCCAGSNGVDGYFIISKDGVGSICGSSTPKPKIFLNPGHGQKSGAYDSGACGSGYEEADLTRELVKMVEENLSGYADVTVYDYTRDLYDDLRNGKTFAWSSYDYFLSIHFDSNDSGGTGTTAYQAWNRNANQFEEKLAEVVSTAGRFRNNGVKKHPDNLAVLNKSDKAQNGGTTGTLLEICYISNASDVEKYQANKQAIAKAISDTFISYFGMTYGASSMPSHWEADWQEKKIPNNAIALKAKTYERYHMIKAQGSKAYEVSHNTLATTHKTGLRVYNNDFLIVALGSYYGKDGTYIKIKFDNGKEIVCIKGDEKDDRETNTEDPAHSYHIDSDTSYVDGRPTTCNLLEVQTDANVIDGQQEFLNAFEEYCGCAESSITNIWISTTEPRWIEGTSENSTTEKEYHFANSNEKIPLHPTLFNQKEMSVPKDDIYFFINDLNVYNYVGYVRWSNATRTLATTMSFKSSKTDTEYVKKYLKEPAIGDIVRYYENGKELFRGMIIDIDYGSRTENSYTAVDAGWWMNKTTDTYQFNSANSKEVVEKILTDLSIPVDYITEALTAKISGVYVDKVISDLLLDILDLNGGQFNFDFTPKGIRIYKYGEFETSPKFKFAPNTKEIDAIEFRGIETHTGSIEDVKNSVKVISETDVLCKAQDIESYNRYGFLQEVVQVNTENITNPESYAKQRLAVMTQAKEVLTFEILEAPGSYSRAGEKIRIGSYDFIIQSTEHKIENGMHHTEMDVWRWKEAYE